MAAAIQDNLIEKALGFCSVAANRLIRSLLLVLFPKSILWALAPLALGGFKSQQKLSDAVPDNYGTLFSFVNAWPRWQLCETIEQQPLCHLIMQAAIGTCNF